MRLWAHLELDDDDGSIGRRPPWRVVGFLLGLSVALLALAAALWLVVAVVHSR